MESKVHQIFWF